MRACVEVSGLSAGGLFDARKIHISGASRANRRAQSGRRQGQAGSSAASSACNDLSNDMKSQTAHTWCSMKQRTRPRN